MRTLSAVLASVVLLWPGISSADALQDAKTQQDIKTLGSGLTERLQDLSLTEQQEAKIAEIRKTFHSKLHEAGMEVTKFTKEEMDKIREILTPEQKTKLAALKEERREHRGESLAERIARFDELDLTDAEMAKIVEIRKEYRPKLVKAIEGLKGVLSEEQKKIREEGLHAGKSRKEVMGLLKLTNEQKEKVEAVCKEVGTLVRDEMHKIHGLLTETQKEKLEDLKEERRERVRDRMAHFVAHSKDLNLTNDQLNKIAEIRKEYRPKIHEAGNKLRTMVREEVEMIMSVIKG